MIGGTLDPRAMVSSARRRSRLTRASPPTSASSACGRCTPRAGIIGRYYEEAELRRVLVQRADRVVGLASRVKLGTTAPFGSPRDRSDAPRDRAGCARRAARAVFEELAFDVVR